MPAEPTIRPKLLTYREAAQVLSVSDRTVATLAKRGDLRVVRVGCSVRIDPNDLGDYIETSKQGGAP